MAMSPKPTCGPCREDSFQLGNFRFARHSPMIYSISDKLTSGLEQFPASGSQAQNTVRTESQSAKRVGTKHGCLCVESQCPCLTGMAVVGSYSAGRRPIRAMRGTRIRASAYRKIDTAVDPGCPCCKSSNNNFAVTKASVP